MECKDWKRLYRSATADFPVSVQYFKPLRVRPHHAGYSRHMEPEFMLVRNGCMELQTPENSWVLHSGDIVFINPNQLHSFRSVNMEVEELCVRFFPEFLQLAPQHYFQKNFLEPLMAGSLRFPTVIREDHPAYTQVYGALSALHPQREGTAGYREQILMTVMSVCCAIAPYCVAAQGEEALFEDAVETCVAYIHSHYVQKLRLEQLSQYVGVHPNYLCTLFRERVGRSVFTYIHDLRMERAKRLLSSTRLSVSEVARQCGYSDLGFFREKFKKANAMTPKEYHKTFYKPNA